MPEQNLNPDALEAAKNAFDHAMGLDTDDYFQPWEEEAPSKYRDIGVEPAVSAYLSALPAQPDTVNSVDYRSTPQGHYDAWQDTGDGYYQRKGWTLTCIWCAAEFTGATKAEALKGYTAHEESIIQKLQEADAERTKDRPVEG